MLSTTEPRRVARHKTAMKRTRLSRPVARALADGVVTNNDTILDFGCGHGTDVRLLAADGFDATGWDPHFSPDAPRSAADVVNLGFVLNVIERLPERQQALREAFDLAKRVLVVAVRVEKNTLADAEEFGDGLLTAHGGFQKFYTQSEFRDYVETVLDAKVELCDIGVAYVFKCEEAYQRYLQNRILGRQVEYRRDLLDLFEADDDAQAYLAGSRERGRLLRRKEFDRWSALVETFGTEDRVRRLARKFLDPDSLAACREERRESILTYLALSRLRGLKYPKMSALDDGLQADVRSMWGSYKVATESAEGFLFQIADADRVAEAIRNSPVGKRLPDALYIHQSAVEHLPALLQLILGAAQMIVGQPDTEVIKISSDGKAVSFLSYPDFDRLAHPTLAYSLRVYLPKADYRLRDYRESENPPLLHRKETFVAEEYDGREKFAKLTKQEEKAGLLDQPSGFLLTWGEQLLDAGYEVRGHRLQRKKA